MKDANVVACWGKPLVRRRCGVTRGMAERRGRMRLGKDALRIDAFRFTGVAVSCIKWEEVASRDDWSMNPNCLAEMLLKKFRWRPRDLCVPPSPVKFSENSSL